MFNFGQSSSQGGFAFGQPPAAGFGGFGQSSSGGMFGGGGFGGFGQSRPGDLLIVVLRSLVKTGSPGGSRRLPGASGASGSRPPALDSGALGSQQHPGPATLSELIPLSRPYQCMSKSPPPFFYSNPNKCRK